MTSWHSGCRLPQYGRGLNSDSFADVLFVLSYPCDGLNGRQLFTHETLWCKFRMSKPHEPEIDTVNDHIAWSYANLARADAALRDRFTKYQPVHHMIRARLFKGLKNGTMAMQSLYDDERIKMTVPNACYYCGSMDNPSIDHLIPRVKGGADDADNLIRACRSCNSSKQGRDMLQWMDSRNAFPAVLLLRRYLKLVARHCTENDLLQLAVPDAMERDLPFDLSLLPHLFPPLSELTLWVYPQSPIAGGQSAE